MPTLTITKNYDDATTLTEAQLDTAFDSVTAFVNTTKLDSTNLQSGAVVEASLGTGAVTEAKIGTAAVTTAKVADLAVTAAKIAADAVTTAKILDANVTTAKILDANVTTAKIADGAVTRAKLAAVGQQVSGWAATSTFTNTGYLEALNVNITTTGRPVIVALISTGSGQAAFGRSSSAGDTVIKFVRDATDVGVYALSHTSASTTFQAGNLVHLDAPAAGTYTYRLEYKTSSGTGWLANVKLVAYEL